MEYKFLKYDIKENVLYITFMRPDVLNSFNREMSLELQNALDIAKDNDEIRAIVLTGEGRAFSAGQDLEEAINPQMNAKDILTIQYNPIIGKLRQLPKPVIAAVNGIAAGAGANIALACDIVIASEKASFIQSFSNIGLIPDSGGTYFIPRLVGLARATAMMMLAEKIDAKTAMEIGLIYKVYQEDVFMYEVESLAKHLSDRPTKALALTKQLLSVTFDNELDSHLNLENELQSIALDSYDYKEGVSAFLEKRKPNYKGF